MFVSTSLFADVGICLRGEELCLIQVIAATFE